MLSFYRGVSGLRLIGNDHGQQHKFPLTRGSPLPPCALMCFATYIYDLRQIAFDAKFSFAPRCLDVLCFDICGLTRGDETTSGANPRTAASCMFLWKSATRRVSREQAHEADRQIAESPAVLYDGEEDGSRGEGRGGER